MVASDTTTGATRRTVSNSRTARGFAILSLLQRYVEINLIPMTIVATILVGLFQSFDNTNQCSIAQYSLFNVHKRWHMQRSRNLSLITSCSRNRETEDVAAETSLSNRKANEESTVFELRV